MIERLLADLQRDEGFRDHAYDDATGEPVVKGSTVQGFVTTGYGFCLDRHRGAPLPKTVADFWLEYIVEGLWLEVQRRMPWIEIQPEEVQRAITNMSYQMGIDGVLRFRNMIEALKSGQRELAAIEALDSAWGRQTPARAKRVTALILGK